MPALEKSILPDLRNLTFAGFLAACALLPSGCEHSPEPKAPFRKIDAQTVEALELSHLSSTKLEQKNFPKLIEIPGRIAIAEKDVVFVSARVSGRIESVSVSAGDLIGRGAILLKIWSPDLAAAVQELESAKKQGNSDLLQLTYQKLASLGLDPNDIHSDSQTSFPLRAPIRGAILEKKVNSGASVNAGDQLLTIGKVDAYQFAGEALPELAVSIKPGMKVLFDERADLEAVVESVSAVPDPSSRLVKVRCRFPRGLPKGIPAETLLKGQVVTSEENALVAPSKALIRSADREFVFIRDRRKPSLFHRLPVAVESRQANEMALKPDASITAGNEVVSEGALLLNNVLEGDE